MNNARGSGSGSGTSTTANDSSNPSLRDATLDSGSGSGSNLSPGSGNCSVYGTTVQLGENGYSSVAEEGNCSPSSISVPIVVGNPSPYCPVSVNYATQDGTAVAGADYTAVSGTASFPAGSSGPVWVNIPIRDDGTDESVGSEIFYVNLSNPVNAKLGSTSQFVVYIEEGPEQAANDTLRWNPCPGSKFLASDPTNWWDVTQRFQLQKGAPGPGPSTPVQFDANPADTPNSNAPITWDKSFTVASISVTGGYDAEMNLPTEGTLTDNGTLNEDAKSTLYMSYSDSTFVVKGGGTLTNFTFDGPGGLFELAHGTLNIAGNNPVLYQESTGVNVDIDSSATLNDQGWNEVAFTADNLTVNVNGEMDVFFGVPKGGILLDSGTNMHNYINVAGGILYYGGSGGVTDIFNNMPLSVNSGGTFKLGSAAGQPNGGTLFVGGSNENTDGASVYMTGSSSTVQLSQGASLECDWAYYQVGGTLKTTDDTTCTLQVSAARGATANISGGNLMIDPYIVASYGELVVNAGLLFDGTYVPQIAGQVEGISDLLKVNGTMIIQPAASLDVYVAGNLEPGNQWTIIIANNQLKPFNNTNESELGLTENVTTNYVLKS